MGSQSSKSCTGTCYLTRGRVQDSMREAVAADAGHYFVAAKEALLGTEEAVDAVQRAWSTPGTGASACAAAAPAAAGV